MGFIGKAKKLLGLRSETRRSHEFDQKVDAKDENTPWGLSLVEFQSGHWLEHDRAEHEKRATPLNGDGLIKVLERVIGPLASTEDYPNGVGTKSMSFYESKHKKVFNAELEDGRSYSLHMPFNLGTAEYRRMRLLSEVATLDFLGSEIFGKDHEKFAVPTVLSYSTSDDNELGLPYILMSYPGDISLASMGNMYSKDIEATRPFIEVMAEVMGEVLKYEFPAYGSIFYKDDMPDGISINDRFVIGPSMEKLFWRGEPSETASIRGPWTCWQDYLNATAEAHRIYARNMAYTPYESAAHRYAMTISALFTTDEFAESRCLTSPRLYVSDLDPEDVFCRDDRYWLAEVGNSVVKPYIVHGVPTFVSGPHERIDTLDEVPNFMNLTEQDRRVIREQLRFLTIPEMIYEAKLKESNEMLMPAHRQSIKRRQSVVRRALDTDLEPESFINLDDAIYDLGTRHWADMELGREFPVQFNEESTTVHMSLLMKQMTDRLRNPYIASKGFIPRDEFHDLLIHRQLKLVDKREGNYVLTKKFFAGK